MLVSLLLLGLNACTKEELDFDKFSCDTCLRINKSSEWDVPLGSLTATLEDFFGDISSRANIKQNALGEYYYEFVDTIANLSKDDLLSGSIAFPPTKNMPAIFSTLQANQEEIQIDTSFDMSPSSLSVGSDIQLKSIKLISGSLRMRVLWDNTDTGSIRMSTYIVNSNGQVVELSSPTLNFPIGTSTGVLDTALNIALTDQVISLATDASQRYNKFPIRLYTKRNRLGSFSRMMQLTFNDENQGNGIKWSLAKGFFGITDVAINPFNSIFKDANSFFSSNISYSSFRFNGSFLEISTSNRGLGIPIKIVDSIRFYKKTAYLSPTITMDFYDNYPTNPDDITYQRTVKRISDGVDDLFSQLPDSLSFRGNLLVSQGRVSGLDTNQFVRSDMRYVVVSREVIPMKFTQLNQVTYSDSTFTGDWNFDTTSVALDSGTFRLRGVNYFPVDFTAKVYVRSQNYAITDSIVLSANQTIPSASVGIDGIANQGTSFEISTSITRQQVEHLMASASLVIKLIVNKNTQYPIISFQQSNHLLVGAGVSVNVHTKTK